MAATITISSGATWQQVAADRQKHRASTLSLLDPPLPTLDENDLPINTIHLARKYLTEEELKITETVPENLVSQLAKGELSSVAVTKAFLRRAGLAQLTTNSITELLPRRALDRAASLDANLAQHQKPIGPLHGLPISVKEHIGMAGLDLNGGFVSWVGRVAEKDALILEILWRAGAVFYVRSTQPQSLMHLETSSNLYGVTTNPFNRTLTAGGSSGGEGALVGFRGSCLGIGTDIGGSIRSPAANNGVYGMKPTSGRLPMGGLTATQLGEEQVVPTIGPLSTSLEGCKLFMKTIIDAKPWYREPTLLPFPWREEDVFKGRKLKVAVMWDDGVVKPHPPVTRALQQIVDRLKGKENIEIVEWKPYKHDLAWEIIAGLYFCDGGADEAEAINSSGEPWRPLTKHILIENPHCKAHTITSMWAATVQRDVYRSEYAALWNETATSTGPNGEPEGMVDVILCPVGPGAAPKIDTSKWWGYTSQWNLLDYPALVFPVDRVDSVKDGKKVRYEPRNEKDKFNWDLWEEYGVEGWEVAPVCLQLVGRRYEDEKVIQALEILQKEAGFPFVEYI